MNYTKFLLKGAAFLAAVCLTASCGLIPNDPSEDEGSEDEEAPGWSDGDQDGDVTNPVMPDEQAKEYLGETAMIVMNMFNPDDQRALAELAIDFAKDYEGYSIDLSEATSSRATPRTSRSLSRFFNEIHKAVVTGQYTNLSRAAQNVLEFGLFTGVYEPDERTRMFKRTYDSNAVIVRFDHRGKRCELTVFASDDYWTMDTYQLTEGDVNAVKVPREINFALTEDSRQLINGSLSTNWEDGRELVISTDVTAMNIRVKGHVYATNSDITTSDALYINDTEVVNVIGEIRGHDMVTTDAIKTIITKVTESYHGYTETWYELNPQRAAEMFQSANTRANLIERATIEAYAPDSKMFIGLETYFDDEDNKNPGEACKQACDILNAAVPVELFLDGRSAASLKWQPRHFEENDYGYHYSWWEAEPVLAFADGSTYSFEDYFEIADFSNIENRFNNLLYEYETMLNALL